jgi:hypothetical protein
MEGKTSLKRDHQTNTSVSAQTLGTKTRFRQAIGFNAELRLCQNLILSEIHANP